MEYRQLREFKRNKEESHHIVRERSRLSGFVAEKIVYQDG